MAFNSMMGTIERRDYFSWFDPSTRAGLASKTKNIFIEVALHTENKVLSIAEIGNGPNEILKMKVFERVLSVS